MASLPFFMILNPTHSCKYQQLILKGYSSMLELSQVPTTDLSSIDYSKKLFFQKKKMKSINSSSNSDAAMHGVGSILSIHDK